MAGKPASHAPPPPVWGLLEPENPPGRPLPLMTRDEIEGRIADGDNLIIYHDQVLMVDAWLPYHPGGDKALLHMVGKDASNEIDILHSVGARRQMLRYRIGYVEGPGRWLSFAPPIQSGVFRTRAEMEQESAKGAGFPGSKDAGSSPATSRTPSPIFDQGNHKAGAQEGLRCRDAAKAKDEARAVSVSVASDSTVEEEVADGMSYIDAVTKQHIKIDLDKYPSLDGETQARINAKYRELHQRVHDQGLYNCNYWAYAVECCRYAALFFGMLFFLRIQWYAPSAFCLGALWHQLVFAAHDAGHMGITHDFHIDSVIGIVIADFVGGLSMGWWKRSHNIHHIVTNTPEHDPDIEHLPFFAVSHRLLGNLPSTYYDRVMKYDAFAKALVRVQAWTYYPILSLARFNLYYLSWDYLIAGRGPKKGPAAWHRWLELAGQVFFWAWFGYGIVYRSLPDGWTRFYFVLISHITSSPLHLQIVLSHFAMSTADLGPRESFPQKMLRTTMDVDCPPWLDFFHGGLQFQVVHHLFPRVPRHNLRTTQKLVQEFCNEIGMPYALYGFAHSNQQVLGKLAEVSRQAAILAKCQKSIAQSGDYLDHFR